MIKKTRTWLDESVPLVIKDDGQPVTATLTVKIPNTDQRTDECPECGALTEPNHVVRFYTTDDKNGPIGEAMLYSCTCPDNIGWHVRWERILSD
jgi:hypothetical protein